MECYRCGGPEGNNARLCPKCTTERIADREAQARSVARMFNRPDSENDEVDSGPALLEGLLTPKIIGGACAAFVGAYVLLLAPFGPGLLISKHEKVYTRCVAKFAQSTEKMAENSAANSPADAMMKEFATAFVGGMSSAVCEGFRDECKMNPSGQKCSAMLKAL